MTTQVGIYIFPDAEVLDFAGPYEVLTTASRVALRQHPQAAPLFSVFSVAAQAGLVRLRAGLEVQPTYTVAHHPPIDLLIVPGGIVTEELEKAAVIEWLRNTAQSASLTASVCTGAFLLAQTGLLKHQPVTTHWEDIADLRNTFPTLQVMEQCRWVDAGRYVTSAGISAGIDMSLHLVERLAGRPLAEATARQMEYDWQEGGSSECR
jgi:transcriptional regulator GlxA family with amidase domain